MIREGLARIYWRLSRWTLRNDPQPDTPRIIVGAPHTSNWDFILMLAICWRSRVPVKWLGKHTLFTGWRGPIMRALGGVPVDRDNPAGILDELLRQHRDGAYSIGISPEGTRGSGKQWKSGFYRLALTSGLPVTLGYVDRNTMTTGLGPTLTMTGDPATDMDAIRAFYADKAGIHPELATVPRLGIEDQAQ